MPALPFIVAAAQVAGAVAAVGGIVQQRKAGKAAQRQAEAERRKAEIENTHKVRQSIRTARMQQASMVNQAALTGGMGGSGLAGGVGSLGSQLSSNLDYMSRIAEENTSIFNSQMAGAKASSNAAVFGQVGKLAGTIFGDAGGITSVIGSGGGSALPSNLMQVGNAPRGDN